MKQNTMRWIVAIVGVMGICTAAGVAGAETAIASASNYMNNRPPLRANPYVPLPVGAIRPEGWLREQLGRIPDIARWSGRGTAGWAAMATVGNVGCIGLMVSCRWRIS
ncbi:MAG TPA: hypothetical protein PKB02_09945 [Anaerohalosphaeraceae bacterium]|nr:hypothetical protein [Anaerohalosphaeraceae bacterium]